MPRKLLLLLPLITWLVFQNATAAPALPYFEHQGVTYSLAQLPKQLRAARVILLGEEHSSYGQHLTQLAIIKALATSGRPLTIAMEYFQRPFQQALDDFIAGTDNEIQMLRKTEYFNRWRYDYRLYQPILQYARAETIPLLALNVPAELTAAVSIKGFAGLSAARQAKLPEHKTHEDAAYIDALRPVYEQHRQQGQGKSLTFEHFLQAQLLWDEGMAERAANYLKTHPGRLMIILTGTQHATYQGIPSRLRRRLPVKILALQPANDINEKQQITYHPLTDTLPKPGLMGVMLKTEKGLEIIGFSAVSLAPSAGLKKGDRIVAVNKQATGDYADLKLALLNKEPGETITVQITRGESTSIKATFKLH